jgi:glucose-1-phosphate thymidylyltransferase
LTEKPSNPTSPYAIPGIYFLDDRASKYAKQAKPSERGELEITAILDRYLDDSNLGVEILDRGVAWLDTGTHQSLLDAGNFVRTIQERQGLQIGCPEEAAFTQGWISRAELLRAAARYQKTSYGEYLLSLGA